MEAYSNSYCSCKSDKSLSWKAVHIENSNPHNIYVIGETVPNVGNLTHNPDIVVAKYQSGFDNANNPDGIIQWQRDIAGISGSTRRDYASDIRLDQDGRVMIAGYTDSNSTAPDDMWVALLDLDGSMMEKRKIALLQVVSIFIRFSGEQMIHSSSVVSLTLQVMLTLLLVRHITILLLSRFSGLSKSNLVLISLLILPLLLMNMVQFM